MRNRRYYDGYGDGYEMLCFMGQGMGQAIEAANQKSAVKAALKRLGGDQPLVLHMVDYGDPEMGSGSASDYHKDTTVEHCLQELVMERWYGIESVAGIETLNDLRSTFGEHCDHDWGRMLHLETPEESDTRRKEERRKELEGIAAGIASRHNVGCNSIEFIQAIHTELEAVERDREDWNNPERRAEEFAACRYAGVGTEVYFDDLNFENGRISARGDTLHDVLEWLAETCPLLWAKWQESQLVAAD